jgi:hypothetical protein
LRRYEKADKDDLVPDGSGFLAVYDHHGTCVCVCGIQVAKPKPEQSMETLIEEKEAPEGINTDSKRFDHVMIDIETWGTGTHAAIGVIAAVEFDPASGDTGRKFYMRPSLKSCLDAGLVMDADTVQFWMNQADEVRKEMLGAEMNLVDVLWKLKHFLRPCGVYLKVWAKSPSFDLVILSTAFRVCLVGKPWHYYNERDVRTMLAILPAYKQKRNYYGESLKHHALDDCIVQIEQVCEAYKLIGA